MNKIKNPNKESSCQPQFGHRPSVLIITFPLLVQFANSKLYICVKKYVWIVLLYRIMLTEFVLVKVG